MPVYASGSRPITLFLSVAAIAVLLMAGAHASPAGSALAGPAPQATATVKPAPTAAPMSIKWAFYVTYNQNSWESLRPNVKSLTHVSPWYFYAGKEGIITGKDESRATALLRESKVKILPMVKNTVELDEWSAVMTDTARLVSMVDQLDALVTTHNYDGITIDFEGLNASDKPHLSAFMQLLYERFQPKQKLVAMAVAAKTREMATGWSAPYDYPALGKVVDHFLIMAYDYSWSTSNPGPIAPVSKLRATADYALKHVPAHKIIWGVGVYGYDWQVNPDTGETDGKAEYRTFLEANALAVAPGAESGYSAEAHAPWVRYTRDDKPREMWYEDRRSFEAKLDLIEERKMSGFGIWRLGQEDPLIWKSINNMRASAACRPVKAFKSSATKVFFKETGHSLGGVFLQYWRDNGGLPVYGYPITEEFIETSPTDGKPYKVQYFERNRFEHHPEKKPPHHVQLGLLGVQVTEGRVFPSAQFYVPAADAVFFPQVEHTLSAAFLGHWQGHGGLGRFGYPISEPVLEQSRLDDKTYLVQYFERARFELHPEYSGTPSEVLLGLLGRDVVPCR